MKIHVTVLIHFHFLSLHIKVDYKDYKFNLPQLFVMCSFKFSFCLYTLGNLMFVLALKSSLQHLPVFLLLFILNIHNSILSLDTVFTHSTYIIFPSCTHCNLFNCIIDFTASILLLSMSPHIHV